MEKINENSQQENKKNQEKEINDSKEKQEKNYIDIDTTKSDLKGMAGILESTFRRFKMVAFFMCLGIIYVLGALCIGISLTPSLYFISYIYKISLSWGDPYHFFAIGVAMFLAFMIYGFTLIFVLPIVNFILPLKLKPWRGIYFSLNSISWYFHNALTYLARYTFLKFITPTPFNVLFYKMMGMKVGKGVQINSYNISDPCMIELGDKVTIGGSATIIGHYATGGFLIIEPVKIEKKGTVGIKGTIMGGVQIGERAKILPNSVVMPKTIIPAGEVWGGVPAQFIKKGKK